MYVKVIQISKYLNKDVNLNRFPIIAQIISKIPIFYFSRLSLNNYNK